MHPCGWLHSRILIPSSWIYNRFFIRHDSLQTDILTEAQHNGHHKKYFFHFAILLLHKKKADVYNFVICKGLCLGLKKQTINKSSFYEKDNLYKKMFQQLTLRDPEFCWLLWWWWDDEELEDDADVDFPSFGKYFDSFSSRSTKTQSDPVK